MLSQAKQQPMRPQLLVSVRNAAEAQAALAGGCDILDIKEPSRGSLGMADAPTIAAIARRRTDSQSVANTSTEATLPLSCFKPETGWPGLETLRSPGEPTAGTFRCSSPGHPRAHPELEPPLSAALGELADWQKSIVVPTLPAELTFLKLGLAQMANAADWIAEWLRVRREFESAAGGSFGWIAVAYADWRAAEAPLPEAVLDAAVKTDCRGILLDTYVKTGRTLLDWMPVHELRSFVEGTRQHRLLTAVAGSVRPEMLPALISAHPDIIAIRTVACRDGDRNGTVDAASVHAFKRRLHSCHAEGR
jgi:uncharacterized protein (UPF0264 family)